MRRAATILALFATVPVLAQSANPQASLLAERADQAGKVLQGQLPAEQVFAPSFLAQVPRAKLAEIGKSLNDQFGPILGIGNLKVTGPGKAQFQFRFAKMAANATIQLEGQEPNRIVGLLITDFVPLDDSPKSILDDFAALHGTAGFTITRLGPGGPQQVLGYQSDRQFAIGSAFKLWVLDALAEDIGRGKRKWSDVVPLTARSLPSGVMQDWPRGTPVTLATLATQMIAISDNTATDMLMQVLGREAIAARVRATGHSAPGRMLPMLTTLEAFSLKLGPAARREAYTSASDAGQAAMLARIDPELSVDKLDLAQLAPGRIWHIDTIEWFASPSDIAGVMQSLQRRKDPRVMQILSVNPGIGKDLAGQFNRFGFKGGSEEGVLNLSWLVQNRRGEWYVVSASWNDPAAPVDTIQFLALARRLLDRVK